MHRVTAAGQGATPWASDSERTSAALPAGLTLESMASSEKCELKKNTYGMTSFTYSSTSGRTNRDSEIRTQEIGM